MRLVLIIMLSLGAFGCGADPHSVRITRQNEKTFMDPMEGIGGLTPEERQLLYLYVLRSGFADSVGGHQPALVGKTIGELIAEERAFEAETGKRDAELSRLAAEGRAKQEALANQLRGMISLMVLSKSPILSGAMNDRRSNRLLVTFAYRNRSSKTIRGFTGTIEFDDSTSRTIGSSNVTIADTINAGQMATGSSTIDSNLLLIDYQRLRDADIADLKIVWLPRSVTFIDGTEPGEE